MRVILLRQAKQDVDAAVAWYQERSRSASKVFIAELTQMIDKLGLPPHVGRPYLADTQRRSFPVFPFSLVDRVRETDTVVLAVAHHRRRAGYWRSP